MPNLNISNDWLAALIVGCGLAGIICMLLATAIFAARNWPEPWNAEIWREVLPRLSLPTLALAASYGVFEFSLLFVPHWVAIATATSFECTYVGLSVVKNLPSDLRKRARRIAQGAVIVSILYNVLSGLFDRNPQLLKGSFDWEHQWPQVVFLEMPLACIHGVPLALVAFLTADLLLHSFSFQPGSSQVINQAETNSQESQGRLWQELNTTLGHLSHRISGLEQNLTNVASDIGNLKVEESSRNQSKPEQERVIPTDPTRPGTPTVELKEQPSASKAATTAPSLKPVTLPAATPSTKESSELPSEATTSLQHVIQLHPTPLSTQPEAVETSGRLHVVPSSGQFDTTVNPGVVREIRRVGTANFTGNLRAEADPKEMHARDKVRAATASHNNPPPVAPRSNNHSEISQLLTELTPVNVPRILAGEAADGGSELPAATLTINSLTEISGGNSMGKLAIQAVDLPAGAKAEPTTGLTLEALLHTVGLVRATLLEKLANSGAKNVEQALALLEHDYPNGLPAGLKTEEFQPIYRELTGDTGRDANWQLPAREELAAMKPVERDYTAYRMKQQGYSNPQIAAAFGKSSGNSAKEWHRAHAVRFGLPLLS